MENIDDLKGNGGETGIRTLETVTRLHAFQACAFDHSATSPQADAHQIRVKARLQWRALY